MTVDDAIEAVARAIDRHHDDYRPTYADGFVTGGPPAEDTARAMWPILSAPLRELHKREIRGAQGVCCVSLTGPR